MTARAEQRPTASAAGWGVALVLASLLLGSVAVLSAPLAVVAAVLLLVGCLAVVDLTLVPACALPACLLTLRPTGLVSLADVVLAAATVAALVLYSSREARNLQPLLWIGLVYQASLVPTLLWVHNSPTTVEWVHSAVLVLGALVTGWATGRHGRAGTSLAWYAGACSVIGLVAVAAALLGAAATGAFSAVYLPGLPKNFLGNSLAVAVAVAVARPDWAGVRARTWNLVVVCCVAGIIAAQSRQALISAIAAAVLVALSDPPERARRLRRVVLVGGVPALAYVVVTLGEQLGDGNRFNSANQRLSWFESSIDLWHTSPLLGVGLRWWYTDVWPERFQPPNVFLEMLTSAGLLGTAGFVVLMLGSLWFLAVGVPATYRSVALAVVGARFVQGQLDLYWVAGTAASLWLITGMALGVQARERVWATPLPTPPPPDPASLDSSRGRGDAGRR